MNHIVLGKDDLDPLGVWLGLTGLVLVIPTWVIAHKVAWKQPLKVQHLHQAIAMPILKATLNRLNSVQSFSRKKISPRMWPNGNLPVCEDWKFDAGARKRNSPVLISETRRSTIGPFINRKVLYRMDPSLYPNHGLAY
jgi:hypothetical protein